MTSDKTSAIELARKANLSYSHERTFEVFEIPDDDFVGESINFYIEAGQRARDTAEKRRAR